MLDWHSGSGEEKGIMPGTEKLRLARRVWKGVQLLAHWRSLNQRPPKYLPCPRLISHNYHSLLEKLLYMAGTLLGFYRDFSSFRRTFTGGILPTVNVQPGSKNSSLWRLCKITAVLKLLAHAVVLYVYSQEPLHTNRESWKVLPRVYQEWLSIFPRSNSVTCKSEWQTSFLPTSALFPA